MNYEKVEKLANLNPNRITLEEVASLLPCFNFKWFAKLIMYAGVRRGEFVKNEDNTYKFVGGNNED
jgi:hypothetical protein